MLQVYQQHKTLSKIIEEADQLHSSIGPSIDSAEQLLSDGHSALNDLTERVRNISDQTANHNEVIYENAAHLKY